MNRRDSIRQIGEIFPLLLRTQTITEVSNVCVNVHNSWHYRLTRYINNIGTKWLFDIFALANRYDFIFLDNDCTIFDNFFAIHGKGDTVGWTYVHTGIALNAEVVIIDTSGKAFMKIAKAQRRLKALLFLLQRDSEHLEGHR